MHQASLGDSLPLKMGFQTAFQHFFFFFCQPQDVSDGEMGSSEAALELLLRLE